MNRSFKRLMLISFLTLGLVMGLPQVGKTVERLAGSIPVPASNTTLAQAQTTQSGMIRFYDLWQLVYERLPDFPMENQYIDRETGDVATTNTLANRLIRYHLLVKGRPPTQRLDWKLTLADYLGANEPVLTYQYPGHDTLAVNPIQGDISAIGQLNRQERDRLVDVLVSIFTGSPSPTPTNISPSNSGDASSPSPAPVEPAPAPVQVGPGAAQLLLQ